MKLTIGMASYNNYTEVWFTIQALRMFHNLADTEILVIDNYGCPRLRAFHAGWGGFRLVEYTDIQGTAPAKNRIFMEARGEWVLAMDSHVMLECGAIQRFREWTERNSGCRDLLHGPMLHDDLRTTADAMNDEWRGNMWGTWRIQDVHPGAEPYEIPMHGMGLFACRKDAWLGFNPEFRGFGGEEGYIHTKFRQEGRRVLCLPFLRWLHHFYTVGSQCHAPYSPQLADIIRNYCIGHRELGLDLQPVVDCFGDETVMRVIHSRREQ